MRTTLTLDRDVAAALERLRKSRDVSFKRIVNEALREGLKRLGAPPRRRARYSTRTADLGRSKPGRLDNVAEVVAIAEGDAFR